VHKFVRNLITEWRRLGLPTANGTVVIAVSGGADSVSLLLALCELKKRGKLDLRLVAAHFNHELRGSESDADEEFVRGLTIKHKIEFATDRAGKLLSDGNLEQNARAARYDFLTRTAGNVEAFAVVTGHTINDQAETFLMNLIRGSGPAGLSGMKPIRILAEDGEKGRKGDGEKDVQSTDLPLSPSPLLPFSAFPLLIRPLLTWAKRIDTEGYCVDSGVEYRYDTMNEDTAFKRVRIRKILLPLLADFNPNIIETLAQTAGLMQSTPAADGNGGGAGQNDVLVLRELKTQSSAELYDTLRGWLGHKRGNTRGLQLKHIQAIERLVLSTKSGRVAELPGDARVVKRGGKLVYEENKVEN
jgi:tRNA(Ile)-lysidine synthase